MVFVWWSYDVCVMIVVLCARVPKHAIIKMCRCDVCDGCVVFVCRVSTKTVKVKIYARSAMLGMAHTHTHTHIHSLTHSLTLSHVHPLTKKIHQRKYTTHRKTPINNPQTKNTKT